MDMPLRLGKILNPTVTDFEKALRSDVFVDKTDLISLTNKAGFTSEQYICISRPRRFGKSVAAHMLVNYYSLLQDNRKLFEGLNISKDPSFETNLNKYNVIFFDVQAILGEKHSVKSLIRHIKSKVRSEVISEHPNVKFSNKGSLIQILSDVVNETRKPFIFIIDEWDCLFREFKNDFAGQKLYLDFLKTLLKGQPYVHLAYMTGILPIKKYGTHSALNMFDEYSMADPAKFSDFTGFTESEAKSLCDRFGLDFELVKEWYDGYVFGESHIYSPLSVKRAMQRKACSNYWNETETFEALKSPINLNFEGLKDRILSLLPQGRVKINTAKFQNDMTSFQSADDVMTLLVHLGYLAYDKDASEVWIPNNEIRQEFRNAVESAKWDGISKLLMASDKLLNETWSLHGDEVAKAIQAAHNELTSILKYNDENSLCCVVTNAYYSSFNYYLLFRELASGKGYIDLLYLPKPSHFDKPCMLIELKWDKSATGAISQIKNKDYPQKVLGYTDNLILVGINYDKKTKEHTCDIEKYQA
ncbi:MAG: ATP-binding protein [Clostridiales bacterium]|jgi:hypothetical protein|nr:ATP-binding protein [Clostridiales bacterium]